MTTSSIFELLTNDVAVVVVVAVAVAAVAAIAVVVAVAAVAVAVAVLGACHVSQSLSFEKTKSKFHREVIFERDHLKKIFFLFVFFC